MTKRAPKKRAANAELPFNRHHRAVGQAAPLIELCLQSGQQVILINRMGQFPSADNIDIDYSSTMKEAFDHLMLQNASIWRLSPPRPLAEHGDP
jgi:4-alpha-glucanotransferase